MTITSSLHARLKKLLSETPSLNVLFDLIDEHNLQAWLVGGVLRDLLLKRELVDVDLAVAGDPTDLAKTWAGEVRGRWFWLDQKRLQSRVLLRTGMIVDFAPLRAATLDGDLRLRDFTINALAYPILPPFYSSQLQGLETAVDDLQSRTLRCCSEHSFSDDPLRLLKGIRHAVTLDMHFLPDCFAQMQLKATLLEKVAGERIKDELGKILASHKAVEGIRLMSHAGLLNALFGPHGEGWNEAVALEELGRLQADCENIQQRAEGGQADPGKSEAFPQMALFLLARFLELYQPGSLPQLLHERLRLSRYQQKLLLALQKLPDPVWLRRAQTAKSGRAQALLVERLGQGETEQLVYLALRSPEFSLDQAVLFSHAFRTHQKLGRVPDLIPGERLQELLKGRPKETLGDFQRRIKAAEIAGEIGSAESAENWLKKQISI